MRLVKAAKASPHAKFYNLSTANANKLAFNAWHVSKKSVSNSYKIFFLSWPYVRYWWKRMDG